MLWRGCCLAFLAMAGFGPLFAAQVADLSRDGIGITVDAESFADYTDWYVSANAGMGTCLVMAEEMGGYILTDKATYLTFVANGGIME